MRRFGKAWSVLQKVNKFPQAGSKEAYMQEQLEERMSLMARLGANLAIVLCCILLAPLIYTLYESGFYAPWTDWLIDKFDNTSIGMLMMSLIFVIYCSMKDCKRSLPKFAYKVASPLRRFFRGFIVGIWNFIIFTIFAILLTYIGVTSLVGKVIFLAFTIVMMIVIIIVGLF